MAELRVSTVQERLVSHFASVDLEIYGIREGDLLKICESKKHNAFLIQAEVDAKYDLIKELMDQAAELVREGMVTGEENLVTCLRGSVEDYIASFEPIMA